jgi:tetratricopeptide (TPR) repeat protein
LSRAFEVHYRLNIHSAGAKDFIRAEIAIYDRLGQAYEQKITGDRADNRKQAIEYFQRSIQIPTTRCSTQLNTLARLGNLYRRLGYYNEAEALYLKCLDIKTELGDRAGIASSWGVLGDIARNRGDYDKAESLYLQSLELLTELGDQAGIANSWGVLGDIARNRGDYDKAESLYQQSLELRTELGDRAGIAISWGCLGGNELGREELAIAEMWLKKALPVMEELQMTWYISETNWDLAQLYRAKDNNHLAQEHYEKSHQLFTQLGAQKELEKIETAWNTQKP